MDIALDSCCDKDSLVLTADTVFFGDERLQEGNGLLHCPRGLHHLGKHHLSFTEELADTFHGLHQRSLNNGNCIREFVQRLTEILFKMVGNALFHGIVQPLLESTFTPDFGPRSRCRYRRLFILHHGRGIGHQQFFCLL